jgi:hypothetical protein
VSPLLKTPAVSHKLTDSTVPLHGIGFFPKHVASIISLIAVALPFGGTLGLTIMSTVFNNVSGIGKDSGFREFDTLRNLPVEQLDAMKADAQVSR